MKSPCRGKIGIIACALIIVPAFLLCFCAGSVSIPIGETVKILFGTLKGEAQSGAYASILLSVRLPRVISALLCGAALSLSGAAMQGLLRNPLADGSTIGVSSGASLGAVLAILAGFTLPNLPISGTMLSAIAAAMLSMLLITALGYAFDKSLSTQTIILIGIIFSMFVSSVLSLLIAFSGEKLRTVTFWTMGSLAASSYSGALSLLIALIIGGGIILSLSRELNAFAIGEENARHIGVNVRRVKLLIMAAVSVLIGVSVAVGGSIAFVGLIVPHMTRLAVGPDHKRLLPLSMAAGGIFLMLADLVSRVIIGGSELPIGVVTSLIGACVFLFIFFRQRRRA